MRWRAAVVTSVVLCAAAARGAAPPGSDWPQWRGPNRDGVAVDSPKLLDSWPKDGPPLIWRSDWVPGCEEGGCGSPVVADGRVFIYANAKLPVGGKPYRFITHKLLEDAGWIPGLPEALARKLEEAWASKSRPATGDNPWPWWDPEKSKKSDVEALLAGNADLGDYVKSFVATLAPEEVRKYGDAIRRRLCIDTPKNKWGCPDGLSWEQLRTLDAMKDRVITTRRHWRWVLEKTKVNSWFMREAFLRSFTWSDAVFCLDAATGKTLWRKEFPEDLKELEKYRKAEWWAFDTSGQGDCVGIGASGTPAVWNGKVYAAGALGLYCFSARDGKLLWHVKGPPEHASPIVVDGIVYHCGSAYNAESGSPAWKNELWVDRGKMGRYSSPLLLTEGGRNCIISSDAGVRQYCCLETTTGKVLWTLRGSVNVQTTMRGDILIVAAPYGGSGTRAYRATPAGAEPLWKRPFIDGCGDIIWQDHLYVPGQVYKCLDLKTGEFNWQHSLHDEAHGAGGYSSPILADGKIYTPMGGVHQQTKGWGDLTYYLTMIRATPEKYEELGTFRPGMCMMTSPALVEGRLCLRLLDAVACYDLREHGVYLDGVSATKDALTFRFAQTGGGLVAPDPAGGAVRCVMVTDATGASTPAGVKITGDDIVVDVKNIPAPFTVSCAAASGLAGRNGKPVPAFEWREARALRFRKCLDRTIMLASDVWLQQDGRWSRRGAFDVAGAQVTEVVLDPEGRGLNLVTDRTWRPGRKVTLTYPCFPVDKGAPRREKLAFTVAEAVRAAASLVKVDEATSGNWKGVYGAEGAMVCGDANTAAAPKCAIVILKYKEDRIPWAPNKADPRYLLKTGEGEERTVSSWHAPEQFEIRVEITDGREHQLALYCMAWNPKCRLSVEVLDADTNTALDTQAVRDYVKGKYLVWNVKGSVTFRVSSTVQEEGTAALASGLFFDPPRR